MTNTDEKNGYILEVDLDYPQELHDLHNDFPLAPEKTKITSDMLSEYQSEMVQILSDVGYKRIKTEKLISSFLPRTRYTLHIENLKYYLKKGLVLTKVHRIIRFSQDRWIAPYVKLCTQKRQVAETKFKKDFWKLLVNALYGKSIEDKRKHVKVELVMRNIQAEKRLRKNTFDSFIVLDENKALFKMRNNIVKMDKPIAIGFTHLELSKFHMFRLHFDSFKQEYQSNLILAYTDTDSFIYYIKTKDIFDDFREKFFNLMDFSDYPKSHICYNDERRKCIGFLKDEMNSNQITEFIGLKPKMYIILQSSEKNLKRAKGVKKSVLDKQISFDNYFDCLFKERYFIHSMNRSQSKNHIIHAIQEKKLSLSPLDDKRYILDDKISTYAYGHYKI